MFTPLRYDSGKLTTIKNGTASGTTITKFDALDWSSGYLQRATSSTAEVRYLAMEDVVTGADEHKDILVLCVNDVEFEADTTGNMSEAYRGTKVSLTDHLKINEGASTDNYVFYISEMVGATTDKKARGYFVMKTT